MYDRLIFSFVRMFHLNHSIFRGVSIISASGGLQQAIIFIFTYQDESHLLSGALHGCLRLVLFEPYSWFNGGFRSEGLLTLLV